MFPSQSLKDRTNMSKTSKKEAQSAESIRKTRRLIGAVAVALIIVLLVLLYVGLNFYIWLVLVAVVYLVASFAQRRLKRKELSL